MLHNLKSAAPFRLLICTALALPLSACFRPQVALQIPPARCAKQIPPSLTADTPSAALPAAPAFTGNAATDWEAIARAWVPFGASQTLQLATANAGRATIIEIYARCEAREAEIRDALQPKRKFLGLF